MTDATGSLDDLILRQQPRPSEAAPPAVSPVPAEAPPPRSPALRDQDLAQLSERAQEQAPAPRLRLEVAHRDGEQKSWVARALQTVRGISGGAQAGVAFAGAPLPGEVTATTFTATWPLDAEATLRVDTVHPQPVHLVVLGESSTGEVLTLGERAPVAVRGVTAKIRLGRFSPGDHHVVVMALAQAPQSLGDVLSGRLDDLLALGLVSTAHLTIIVG